MSSKLLAVIGEETHELKIIGVNDAVIISHIDYSTMEVTRWFLDSKTVKEIGTALINAHDDEFPCQKLP